MKWFAVKMVGADAVGFVWLPKFPRTSAEFPHSAAATHVAASVTSPSGARWGAKKPPSTAFTWLVCAFYHATGCYHPQISFIEQLFQETRAYFGREKHNAPTRPPLPLKVNAGPQIHVVSFLPAPQSRLEIIWVQGKPGRGP